MNILVVAVWTAVLLSSAVLLYGPRRSRPRAAGPAPRAHDLTEGAFLVGGPGTVVDATLVSLLKDGRLAGGGPGIIQPGPGARAQDPVEEAVFRACRSIPSGWLYQVRYAAMRDPAVQRVGDALAARGLVSPSGSARTWRRWGIVQAVLCAVLTLVSVPFTFVLYTVEGGDGRLPLVVLVGPVLLAGIVLGVVGRKRAGKRTTPAGRRALRALRAGHPKATDPYVLTALFGLGALPDPLLRALLASAARSTRLAAHQERSRARTANTAVTGAAASAVVLPVVWCAGSDGGGGSSGCGGNSGCGSSACGGGGGSSCGGGGGCGSSGSDGGGGSSCGGGGGGGGCGGGS